MSRTLAFVLDWAVCSFNPAGYGSVPHKGRLRHSLILVALGWIRTSDHRKILVAQLGVEPRTEGYEPTMIPFQTPRDNLGSFCWTRTSLILG